MTFPRTTGLHLFIGLCFLRGIGSMGPFEMDLLFVDRRPHSSLELVKEFFNRTLLPSCDLTVGLCDVNCCSDKDCDEGDLTTFGCSQEDNLSSDLIFQDPFYCYNRLSQLPSLDPILCYEAENTPFLGTFFLERDILNKRKAVDVFPVGSTKTFKREDPPEGEEGSKYIYGAAIREAANTHQPVVVPSYLLVGGYCSSNEPVRYLINSNSVCASKINSEICESKNELSLVYYLKENDRGELTPPNIYSGNSTFQVQVNVVVFCVEDIFDSPDFFTPGDNHTPCTEDLKDVKSAKFDGFRNVCQNVVSKVAYNFTWFENVLQNVNLEITLSDISLTDSRKKFVPSRKAGQLQVLQTFNVQFHSVEKQNRRLRYKSYRRRDDILLNNLRRFEQCDV